MKQRYFITGVGTNLGKSFITAAMARQAIALGLTAMAYKPVVSGFNPADPADSDTALLAASLNVPLTPATIEKISPWRYAAPLAPSMAARLERRPLDFAALTQHSRDITNGPEDIVLIEGVGGVMVPLTERETVLDWIAAIGIPSLLVTGTYLGAISHTLTALSVMRQRNLPVSAVILNQSATADEVDSELTLDELRRWTQSPVIYVPRDPPTPINNLNALLRVLA